MKSNVDCNTCRHHRQGEHPDLFCQACLSLTASPQQHLRLSERHDRYLPCWEPIMQTFKNTSLGLIDADKVTVSSPTGRFEEAPVVPAFVEMDPTHDDDALYATLELPVAATPVEAAPASINAAMRQFASGATRNLDTGRIDPEGFISPAVLLRYCEYMNRNRVQADGNVRSGDNWQKGIPIAAYRQSIQRHNLELWMLTRNPAYEHPEGKNVEDVLCALMFNVMGMLFETLKEGQ